MDHTRTLIWFGAVVLIAVLAYLLSEWWSERRGRKVLRKDLPSAGQLPPEFDKPLSPAALETLAQGDAILGTAPRGRASPPRPRPVSSSSKSPPAKPKKGRGRK
jgi:hypothetical protein